MLKKIMYKAAKMTVIVLLCLNTTACIGTVVGAVVDTTIEVIKIPFKVGAAVIDVATDDEFTDTVNGSSPEQSELSTEDAAIKMENAEIQ